MCTRINFGSRPRYFSHQCTMVELYLLLERFWKLGRVARNQQELAVHVPACFSGVSHWQVINLLQALALAPKYVGLLACPIQSQSAEEVASPNSLRVCALHGMPNKFSDSSKGSESDVPTIKGECKVPQLTFYIGSDYGGGEQSACVSLRKEFSIVADVALVASMISKSACSESSCGSASCVSRSPKVKNPSQSCLQLRCKLPNRLRRPPIHYGMSF